MKEVTSIHLLGADPSPSAWASASVAARHAHRSPSTDEFRRIDPYTPVTFAMADKVTPVDLARPRTEADITLIVTDASAEGRVSPDLAAALWNLAPAVALFLAGPIPEIGAVTFLPRVLERLPKSPSWPGDPLTSAIAELLSQGASIHAVVTPGASRAAFPQDPPALAPGSEPDREWRGRLITRLDDASLLGRTNSGADAAAVRAGLLLWNDLLDDSHSVSQSIEGEGRRRAGDHWHAIMHRREPDYANAKYWFRRVGRTAVHDALASRGEMLTADAGDSGRGLLESLCPGGVWDALAFVDACSESARSGDAETDRLLRRFQADEMLLLLRQTCDDALA